MQPFFWYDIACESKQDNVHYYQYIFYFFFPFIFSHGLKKKTLPVNNALYLDDT